MIETASGAARGRLAAVLDLGGWIDAVAAGGPYPDVDALAAAGRRAAEALSDSELDAAAAVLSEPLAVDGLGAAADGDDAAFARGTEVFLQRFGRPFLLDGAGLERNEVLDELQRRLKNEPEAEADEARAQLGAIVARGLRARFPAER